MATALTLVRGLPGSGLTNVCAGSELRRQLKNEAGSMKPPLKMRT